MILKTSGGECSNYAYLVAVDTRLREMSMRTNINIIGGKL